jgi:type I restriction-modification system DNA methylase subunit
MPFIEQMQDLLAEDGYLVFIAPSNYLIQRGATVFRKELRRDTLQEFILLPEGIFRHWKVQTILTSLKKDDSIGRDGHFWIEPMAWDCSITELLESVGITDQDRLDKAVEEYRDSYNFLDGLLDNRRKLGGEELGYDMSRFPKGHNPTDDHQSDIGNWV